MLEQSILESAGYDVELATRPRRRSSKLGTRATYALMLVDVEMPGMDGFGFVAELRAAAARSRAIPAILVTSRDAPADRARGAAVGAQGYIVKGQFDQGELLALIRAAGARRDPRARRRRLADRARRASSRSSPATRRSRSSARPATVGARSSSRPRCAPTS